MSPPISLYVAKVAQGLGDGSDSGNPMSFTDFITATDGTEIPVVTDLTATAVDLLLLDEATTGVVDAASVLMLTGTSFFVAEAYAANTAGTISGLGNETVTLFAGTASASDLNAIDAATDGLIDASSVTTLTGSLSAVATAYASSGISLDGDEAVTLDDTTVAASDLNALDGETSGVIDASSVTTLTGSLSAVATAYASSGISLDGGEAVTLDDTTVAASDLNGLDGETSGMIDASSVTTLTGTAAAVATAYASSGISGLGNEAVTLDDTTVAASDLNAIDALTSGSIDTSSVTTLIGTWDEISTAFGSEGLALTGSENIVLLEAEMAASYLNAIDAATSGTIDVSYVTTLSGSLSEVDVSYASSGITGLEATAVTISDTTAAASDLSALDLLTSGTIDASSVTTVTGTASEVAAAYMSSGISGLGAAAVALSGATAAAPDLNAIDAATSGLVDASSVTTVTGTASAIALAYASSGISGLGDEAVTLDDTTVAAADLNALDGETGGVIDASSVTTLTGTASAVATAYASSGISGLGNEAVTLTGTLGAATDLNAINAATTGTVDMTSILTVTGSLSDLATTYTSTGFSGRGDEAVTLSDTTVAAASLSSLDSKTTGVIDASSVTTLTGTLSTVMAAYAANTAGTISGLGNEAVTLSDTTATSTGLNTLDTNTSGVIDASSVTTVIGKAAAVATAFASSGINGLGAAAVTLSAGGVAASDLNSIDAGTSGAINASAVTTLTGTASAVATAYASSGISGLGKEAVTLSLGSAAASDLNAIETATIGAINASRVTTVTGTASAVATVYASGSFIGLGNEAVILSDTVAAAVDLNAVNTATAGLVNMTSVLTVTGSLSDLTLTYSSTGFSGRGNEAITLLDGTATATALNTLDAATTGVIDASSVGTLTGTASAIAVAYASSGISGLGNEAVTLTDTIGVAASLNAIDAATSGIVDASSVTTLSGTAVTVAAAYASSGITGLGNEAVALSDTTVAAASLNAIDAATSGLINVSSVRTVMGTASVVATSYASSGISGLGNEAVILSDTIAASTDLNAINAATTGAVNAASLLTVEGSLSALTTTYTTRGVSGLGNEALTLNDTTVAAASLNYLDTRTTGVIDASSVETLTGALAAVATAYASAGISGLGNAAVTLSDTTAAASALNAVDSGTTGAIDASSVTRVGGDASAVAAAYASSGITGFGNEAVILSGTVAAAADLNAINAATTGAVTMTSVLTVTGVLSDLTTMYSASGFRGRGDEAITLSDTAATATALNSLDGKTTGVIDASSVTTLSGTVSEVTTANASAGITGLVNAAFNVTGTEAADTINGGIHDDTLSGFGGSDILNGGAGADTMTGGAAADTFIFVAGQGDGDNVTDFSGVIGDGDVLVFQGYGDGASFNDLGGGFYEIADAGRTVVDVIQVTGTVGLEDYRFELLV